MFNQNEVTAKAKEFRFPTCNFRFNLVNHRLEKNEYAYGQSR